MTYPKRQRFAGDESPGQYRSRAESSGLGPVQPRQRWGRVRYRGSHPVAREVRAMEISRGCMAGCGHGSGEEECALRWSPSLGRHPKTIRARHSAPCSSTSCNHR